MKLPEFPKVLRQDSVSVVIYKTPSKGYEEDLIYRLGQFKAVVQGNIRTPSG